MKRLVVALILTASLRPAGVAAQASGPYRFEAGDTVTMREVTSTVVRIETPQGEVVAQSDHDASIGMTPRSDGGMDAWFTALSLRAAGPGGEDRPATEVMLGQPYRLEISPTGEIETVTAPTMPAPIAALTDLTHQFFDFLVVVPAERPSPGDTWQDTLRTTESGIPETTQTIQTVRSYTVRGDTVSAGVTALVIDVRTEVSIESTAPMEGQPITVTTRLAGEETGVVLFDWEGGGMLERTREGQLTGTFRINAPQPAEFPQVMTFSSRIDGSR